MKSLFSFFLLLSLVFTMHANPVHPMTDNVRKVTIDVKESTIRWDGHKLGKSHFGGINLHSGELHFSGNQLNGGHFVMDMTSISVHDLTGSYQTKLEDHLKSDDFFGVATFPKARFEITKATPKGNGKYLIEGNLSIKKNTHPLTFESNVDQNGNMTVADAKMKVDRSKYDVRFGSGSFFSNLGDKAIYDEFDIQVNLVGREDAVN